MGRGRHTFSFDNRTKFRTAKFKAFNHRPTLCLQSSGLCYHHRLFHLIYFICFPFWHNHLWLVHFNNTAYVAALPHSRVVDFQGLRAQTKSDSKNSDMEKSLGQKTLVSRNLTAHRMTQIPIPSHWGLAHLLGNWSGISVHRMSYKLLRPQPNPSSKLGQMFTWVKAGIFHGNLCSKDLFYVFVGSRIAKSMEKGKNRWGLFHHSLWIVVPLCLCWNKGSK